MYGTFIAGITLSSSANILDFTSIPNTYTDLVVVFSARTLAGGGGGATDTASLILNGSGGSNSGKQILGNGTTVSSSAFATFYVNGNGASTSAFGNVVITIPNYAGSANKNFTIDAVAETNSTSAPINVNSVTTTITAAVTQVSLIPAGVNFMQYTSAYLYGVTKGSGGATVA